jgi:serine protease Do
MSGPARKQEVRAKMKRNAVAWAALVVSGAALLGVRLPGHPLKAEQDVPVEGRRTARELSAAFNAVAEFVKPSVVQINVEKRLPGNRARRAPGAPNNRPDNARPVDPDELEDMLRRFFGGDGQGPGQGQGRFRIEPQQMAIGLGSGFVYDDKGHVLTNNHVVEGATKIVVTFHDGVQAKAELVGTFPEADVAVIKVDNTSYRPVKVGTTKGLKVGDWVLAIGSPFGLSQTVTSGIVSATERDNLHINQFESFIQTDAAINRGNSGGPLVDMNGRVIGINSAIATATQSNAGVGFTIPIDMAARLADRLIQSGKIEPMLIGVNVDPLTPALARQFGLDPQTDGVVIVELGQDSPAAKAGLRVGDVITTFDGAPVRTREGLQYLVRTSEPDKSYELSYLREGKPFAAKVKPEPLEKVARTMRRPEGGRREAPAEAKPAAEVNDFGIAVTPLTPELAKKYGWEDGMAGLVVTEVKPDSPAAESGLEEGDLITRYVQDRAIRPARSADEFRKLTEGSAEISIYVEDVNHRLPGEFKTLTKPAEVVKH